MLTMLTELVLDRASTTLVSNTYHTAKQVRLIYNGRHVPWSFEM